MKGRGAHDAHSLHDAPFNHRPEGHRAEAVGSESATLRQTPLGYGAKQRERLWSSPSLWAYELLN